LEEARQNPTGQDTTTFVDEASCPPTPVGTIEEVAGPGAKARKTRRKATPADLPALLLAAPGTDRALHGDVLAVHHDNYQWLPDASIDLVLTDPPFNIAQDTNFHTYEKNTINSYRFDADKGWDTYTPESFVDLLGDWAREFARVLRPGGSFAVFCADAYVSHLIDALTAAGMNPRRTLTWRKPNAVPINRQTMMMSACEYVVVGVKGSNATFNSDLLTADPAVITEIEQVLAADKAASIVEKAVRDAVAAVTTAGTGRGKDVAAAVAAAVNAASTEAAKRVKAMYVDDGEGEYLRGCVPNHISFNSKAGNRIHPTEKPVPLLQYLAKLLSRPGDVILDPFAGSGSTGEAARRTGRKCVLVEMDQEFFTKLSTRMRTLASEAGPTTPAAAGDIS
jgi:site-specific DNA-methyltransferase (adenine-specific)